MVPLRVRAHLASGIACAAPWGIALDGLLAAMVWEPIKAATATAPGYVRAMDASEPPDLDLPLARCTPAGAPWHWAATCAWAEGHGEIVDVRYWSGRVDQRELEVAASALPKVVSARQGRYRAHRMPLLVTPTASVTWTCVGERKTITDLLAGVGHIGKKRAAGEGRVLSFDVQDAPELDLFAAAHLHPDASLGRPTPPACLAGRPPTRHGGAAAAGIRPPYVHRARQHQLLLPAPALS